MEEEEWIGQQEIIKKTQQKLQKTGKLGNVIDKNENKSVDERQVIKVDIGDEIEKFSLHCRNEQYQGCRVARIGIGEQWKMGRSFRQ